jgi:hypothetical protein
MDIETRSKTLSESKYPQRYILNPLTSTNYGRTEKFGFAFSAIDIAQTTRVSLLVAIHRF